MATIPSRPVSAVPGLAGYPTHPSVIGLQRPFVPVRVPENGDSPLALGY